MLNPDFESKDHFFQKSYSSGLRTDLGGFFNQLIHWTIWSRVPDEFLFSKTLEVETGNNGRI